MIATRSRNICALSNAGGSAALRVGEDRNEMIANDDVRAIFAAPAPWVGEDRNAHGFEHADLTPGAAPALRGR